MKTLIKNGRIVTAVDDYKADILIKDESVSVVGKVFVGENKRASKI
jgi:dihydropyrimidinase